MKTRITEKDDGTKNYKTEVILSHLIFLNKKSDFETQEDIEADKIIEEEYDKF
jgi:hypothetical protein